MAKATVDFFSRAYGGLGGNQDFIEKISRGDVQNPRRPDRQALCHKHKSGTTHRLISDLLQYVGQIRGTSCKLRESVSALKCILEEHFESGTEIKTLYAQEIAKRKHKSRSNVYRSIGSTLLVKGLEFEHSVIIRGADWQRSWGGYNDLYVALTRGAKTVTLMELG
jgi:DNA helicase-2/ATP-dependent DNA helicase PcrA